MSSSHRRHLIAGNWKMNNRVNEARELMNPIIHEIGQQTDVHAAICPPFTALAAVGEMISNTNIQLGAQNMHHESSGAFTGEVSPGMLREHYVSFVILGHSERRQYFQETNEQINQKVNAAVANSLKPILCVGETLEEREADRTFDIVREQLKTGLRDLFVDRNDQVVIAYEPVWAIGTGKTATPQIAQEVHAEIRKCLSEIYDEQTSKSIRIIYGGSMKPSNADDLLSQADIDGGLIGGASLDSKAFSKLVEAAQQKKS